MSLPRLTGQSSTPGRWLLDRPVKPGDDSAVCVNLTLRIVARMSGAICGSCGPSRISLRSCGLRLRLCPSHRLDAGFADHLAPHRELRLEARGETFGRAGDGIKAERRQAFFHVGLCEHADNPTIKRR